MAHKGEIMPPARNFAAFVCALVLASSVALAENPASWNFLEAVDNGGTASWISPTPVDPIYSVYDYTFEITSFEVGTRILGTVYFTSLIGAIPVEDRTGSGTSYGVPPFTIRDQMMSEAGNTAHVLVTVDSNGYAHVNVSEVAISFDAVRLGGTITVTGTPEPVTIAMMCMGGGLLLKRRRLA
jgi:hypothetical protein